MKKSITRGMTVILEGVDISDRVREVVVEEPMTAEQLGLTGPWYATLAEEQARRILGAIDSAAEPVAAGSPGGGEERACRGAPESAAETPG